MNEKQEQKGTNQTGKNELNKKEGNSENDMDNSGKKRETKNNRYYMIL